jgi:hypothetical protein
LKENAKEDKNMKVNKLIEELLKLDGDKEVVMSVECGFVIEDIDHINETEKQIRLCADQAD